MKGVLSIDSELTSVSLIAIAVNKFTFIWAWTRASAGELELASLKLQLIRFATHHGEPGHTVTIELPSNGSVVYEVSDSGTPCLPEAGAKPRR